MRSGSAQCPRGPRTQLRRALADRADGLRLPRPPARGARQCVGGPAGPARRPDGGGRRRRLHGHAPPPLPMR
jgi:hypothetical protein